MSESIPFSFHLESEKRKAYKRQNFSPSVQIPYRNVTQAMLIPGDGKLKF